MQSIKFLSMPVLSERFLVTSFLGMTGSEVVEMTTNAFINYGIWLPS